MKVIRIIRIILRFCWTQVRKFAALVRVLCESDEAMTVLKCSLFHQPRFHCAMKCSHLFETN
jgi:hypothetical protein